MSTVTIVMLVILAILIAAFIALYFFGKKMEKKQAAQKLYAEYIEEMMRNYMVTEQTGFSYQVHLPAAQAAVDGALSYDLFYLDENGREVTPFREDDRVKPLAGREDGRAYIEENI